VLPLRSLLVALRRGLPTDRSSAQRRLARCAAAAVAAGLLAFGPPPVGAQAAQPTRAAAPTAVTGAYATRAQLGTALAEAVRRGTAADAARIRERLAAGDFRAGDRLAVTLTVDSTRQFELVVRDSQLVEVAPLGTLSLRGVLRSEAQPAVLRFYQRYYRNPQVRVQPLLRVGILGAVPKPAYYSVPPDQPIADALVALAGGPAGNADAGRIEVRRGAQRVLDRKAYSRAAREGLTFAVAGVRSGDEVQVPERKNRSTGQLVQTAFFGLSALTSLLFLIRAFYND
jgi:protein involved in polysaccharide export with SLBB domain